MTSFLRKWIGKEGEDGPLVSVDEAKLSFLEMRWDNQLAQLFFAQAATPALTSSFMAYQKQLVALAPDDLISVAAEINLLREYLALYTQLTEANFYYSLEEKIEGAHTIPALLLFPVVKNAIQFGYNSMPERPLKIKIVSIGNRIGMEVSNRVNHHVVSQADTALLHQFKKRLQYGYPDSYSLFSNSNSATFKVNFQFTIA